MNTLVDKTKFAFSADTISRMTARESGL